MDPVKDVDVKKEETKKETVKVEETKKEERMISESRMNEIVQDRLAQQRRSVSANIEDYLPDDLKGDLAKLKEFREKEAELAEENAKKEGKFDTLMSTRETEHAAKVAGLEAKFTSERINNVRDKTEMAIATSFLKLGGSPEAVTDAVQIIANDRSLKFELTDERKVIIVNDKGEELVKDDTFEKVTPESIVSVFLEKRPHFCTNKAGTSISGQSVIGQKDRLSGALQKTQGEATNLKDHIENLTKAGILK